MKKNISLFLIVYLCFVTLFSIEIMAQSSVPQYTGTAKYPYWGTYVNTPMSAVTAAPWVSSDNVINNWDWSLPTFVKAPKKSTFSMLRVFGLNQESKLSALVAPRFPCKPTVAHWVDWKDLEAVEGTYTFSKLISNIRLAYSKGYKSIIRIHSSATRFAPDWVGTLGIKTISYPDASIVNYDVRDPKFHSRYLKLVDAIGKSGIPLMQEVVGLYVGYASKSMGDEGIGPYHNTLTGNDTVQHVRERLEAWANITVGVRDKVFMGGPTNYGQSFGFGLRRGFVENYLYTLPDDNIGQKIDANNYLYVDETCPIIAKNAFNGEENEEYSIDYAQKIKSYQYSNLDTNLTTQSFPYRYFSSNLRVLQMRCNELLNYPYALMPEMFAWLGQELGRTLDETPDVWTFLRESYIENTKRRPVKNFERWLYQRDATGYTTTPAIRIDHGHKMWMCADDRRYDYIAREGKKIGFNVDKKWPALKVALAFKITVFDNYAGTLNLKYSNGTTIKTISKPLLGDNIMRTYTIFVSDFKANSSIGNNYDFTLESESDSKNIIVSFVRIVQADETITSIVNSNYNGKTLKVYPVPAHDKLNITLPSGAKIMSYTITDVLGKIQSKNSCEAFEGNLSIDVLALKSGYYILQLNSDNSSTLSVSFIKR